MHLQSWNILCCQIASHGLSAVKRMCYRRSMQPKWYMCAEPTQGLKAVPAPVLTPGSSISPVVTLVQLNPSRSIHMAPEVMRVRWLEIGGKLCLDWKELGAVEREALALLPGCGTWNPCTSQAGWGSFQIIFQLYVMASCRHLLASFLLLFTCMCQEHFEINRRFSGCVPCKLSFNITLWTYKLRRIRFFFPGDCGKFNST